MKKALFGASLLLPFFLVGSAMAQPTQPQEPRTRALLLVQSELSHLEGADLPITLRIDNASPRNTLSRIEKAVRFTIEVEGELPRGPGLTVSFDDTPAKEVLVWFAERVGVVYRAERATKLVVLVKPDA